MNQNRRNAFVGIIMLLVWSGISMGAGAADLKKLFYSSAKAQKMNIVTEYKEECGVYSPDELEKVYYNGILAWDECDLDGDGQTELLTISIKGDELGSNNMLTAKVYALTTRDGKSVFVPQGESVLTNNLMLHDQTDCSVFLLKYKGKNLVCCENKEEANIIYSDSWWEWKTYQYQAGSFQEYQDLVIDNKTGNRELNKIRKKVEKMSISANQLVTEPIINQNLDSVKKICRIKRGSTKSNEEILKYMNHGDGQIFYYGETIFKSYVNTEYENVIISSFSSKKESSVQNSNLHSELDALNSLFQKGEGNGSSQSGATSGITINPAPEAPNSLVYEDAYLNSYAGYETEFILPESNSRYLADADLNYLSKEELRLARNEIYARHGRIFNDMELNTYFNGKSWYRGTVPASAFTYEYAQRVFNDYEIVNIGLIQEYESYQ